MNKLLILTISIIAALQAGAQNMDVRWHNESSDTIVITDWLKEAASKRFETAGARTAWLARQMEGRPYVAHTLEGDTEALTVNVDELDCTTFAETVMALSYTLAEQREGWQDFVYNLRRLRYRQGVVNGYSSRLHYICDWAMDNIHRGNFIDATPLFTKSKYMVRSIDFMTSHRDSYPALKDSLQYARVRDVENGYRNHRFPYLKSNDVAGKDVLAGIYEGDILAFVSSMKDLDVTHMGIAVKGDDGALHVLHASSTEGKVTVSTQPLPEFLRRNRQWIGIRIFRLKD